MPNVRRALAALVAATHLVLLAACEDAPTQPDVIDVTARVTGRVLRADGTPARGVWVWVGLRGTAFRGAILPGTYADAGGEFSMLLEASVATPRLAPDTMGARVGASDPAHWYATGDDLAVVDTVLLTLTPRGTTPVAVSLTLRLPEP